MFQKDVFKFVTTIFVLVLLFAGCGTSSTTTTDEISPDGDAPTGDSDTESDSSIIFAKRLGGSKTDGAFSVQQTSDGGYIVAGYVCSFGAGDDDAWIIKFDSSGAVEWQKAYGDARAEGFYSIDLTSDDGYVVSGYSSSFSSGVYDIWVLKLNSSGSIEWQKSYGGAQIDGNWTSIKQTPDGGYIVASDTASYGNGSNDVWVLKLDTSGNIEWQKTYGGTDSDQAYSIQTTSDGGYIVAGNTASFGGGWVLKLNSTGEIEWQKVFIEIIYSIQQVSGGGYIAVGDGVIVSKLSADGEVEWQKEYSGSSNKAHSIKQTLDGGYIVSGNIKTDDSSMEDVWALKLNNIGEVEWQHAYGGTKYDGMRWTSIQQTSDSGYVLVSEFGSVNVSTGIGDYDAWIIKMGSDGNMTFAPSSGVTISTPLLTISNFSEATSPSTVTAGITDVVPISSNAIITDTTASIEQQTP